MRPRRRPITSRTRRSDAFTASPRSGAPGMTTQDTAQKDRAETLQAEMDRLLALMHDPLAVRSWMLRGEMDSSVLVRAETLEAELSALRAAVQEVRPYLEHKDGCQQRCAPTPLSSRMCEHGTKSCMMLHGACTCGLDRLSRLLEPQG